MGMERMTPARDPTAVELARRTAMLSAISEASAAIVAAADWRRAIGDMLEQLGRAAEAGRASLFEVHMGPKGSFVQSCRFDWAEPPRQPLSTNPLFHDMLLADDPERPDEVAEWSQRRRRGEVVQATVEQVSGRILAAYREADSLSFISVPVIVGGRWWGFIGFDDCNSPRVWSPVEVDVLKTAAGLVASAVERQQAQEEVARRTSMMDAVSEAAAKVVAPGDWRHAIEALLRRLGEVTGVSRATLFEAHPGPDGYLVQSCRYDWAEPPLSPLSGDPRYRDMPLSDEGDPPEILGEWARRRQRGEVVQANLRDLAGYARQVFIEHGTLSFLSVPVMVAGRWWGFLGFDDGKVERDWTSAELSVLKTAAALIGGAIERAQADARLRQSEERYALAARGANDGLWDWDIVTGQAYFSPRLHELLELADGELGTEFQRFLALLPEGDRRTLQEMFARLFARRRNRMRAELRIACNGEMRHFVLRGLIVYEDDEPRRAVGSLRDVTDWANANQQLQEAERRRARLARYFSPNMVDELMQTAGDLRRVRTQTVTVLFADIWDFTRLTAGTPAEEIVPLLREFLGLAEEAVFSHNGTLDKFLGDGLLGNFRHAAQRPARRHQCDRLCGHDDEQGRRLEPPASGEGTRSLAHRHRSAHGSGGSRGYRQRAPHGVCRAGGNRQPGEPHREVVAAAGRRGGGERQRRRSGAAGRRRGFTQGFPGLRQLPAARGCGQAAPLGPGGGARRLGCKEGGWFPETGQECREESARLIMDPLFAEVERYIDRMFAPTDAALDATLESSVAAGMPQIHVSASQGKLLYLLAKLCRARRILEIGTLAGYSTIWLGRALPAGGQLISLEYDAGHARLATANIARAGLADRVKVLVGPALETLAELAAAGDPPFDLVFIDADKPSYPDYLTWAIRLARPGGLILADNVVREGGILDARNPDESVQAARAFNAKLAAETRVEAVVLQQVGAKGHDGLAMAVVK